MSQGLSYTPKATKQTRWPAFLIFVLQTATEDCCNMPVQNVLLPVCSLSLFRLCSQTGICESFVRGRGTEIRPFGSHLGSSISKATEKGLIRVYVAACPLSLSALSSTAVLFPSLAQQVQLGRPFRFRRAVSFFTSHTALDPSFAYAHVEAAFVLSVFAWGQMPVLSL